MLPGAEVYLSIKILKGLKIRVMLINYLFNKLWDVGYVEGTSVVLPKLFSVAGVLCHALP